MNKVKIGISTVLAVVLLQGVSVSSYAIQRDGYPKVKTVTLKTNRVIQSKTNTPFVDFSDVTKVSNISTEALRKMLAGKPLESIASAFVKAEEKTGINALVLVGIAGEESGHGTSDRANSDKNNLTGMGVNTVKSEGKGYSSWSECIMDTAMLLRDCYTQEGQKYYVDKSIEGINTYYSANPEWADNVKGVIDYYTRKVK